MNNKKFKQIITPNSECLINIEFINNSSTIDSDSFFKTYKISKIFKGKYFIKRLIKKIFKHHLSSSLVWDNKFWDKISISKNNTKIHYINPCSYKEMCKELVKFTNKQRMNDILKYKELILSDCNLNHPLYITGRALNHLGADISNDKVFILDGSRRLVANIFAKINPDILIIDLKINN